MAEIKAERCSSRHPYDFQICIQVCPLRLVSNCESFFAMSTGQSMNVGGGRLARGQHTKEIHTALCPLAPRPPPHHMPSNEGKSLKSEGSASDVQYLTLNTS